MKTLGLNLLFIPLLLTIAACSRQYKVSSITPGKTTVDQALKILNEPISVKKSSINEEMGLIYKWEDVSLQVKDKVVKAIHRGPATHEKDLQFWRQKYQGVESKLTQLQSPGEGLLRMNIPSAGLNILYNQRNDQVVTVTEYETL